MWARRKKQEDEGSWRGAARAGLAGAPREELMREAIHSLSMDGRADRIGVWLEQDSPNGADGHAAACLRGMIWEAEGEDTPDEWEKLSLEAPLPQDLLAAGKSVEQELDVSQDRPPNQPMIGPLVGLRRALWTPIEGRGHLRGVLLTGTRRKQTAMSRHLAQSVAAELALALEFEMEQRFARERKADVRLSRQILGALAGSTSAEEILSRLVTSCTEVSADGSGAGASFAVIGHRPARAPNPLSPAEMEFAWESGDPAWTHAIAREPLSSLWRGALDAGQVLGEEPPASWAKAGLARLVAIPLLSATETLGVLVAGIPQKTASLATLERLELRASLAVSALERRRLRAEQIRRTARRHALLEFSPEPTVLLDASGNTRAGGEEPGR